MLKEFLESALEEELDQYLDEEQRIKGNRKNGYGSKQLKTGEVTLDLSTPRDRLVTLNPRPYVKEIRDWQKIRAKNHCYVWAGDELQRYIGTYKRYVRHGYFCSYLISHNRQGSTIGN